LKRKIKICGINDLESIKASSEADYIGFVFFQKSPRFVTAMKAKELAKFSQNKQKKVGLFVDADLNLIEHIVNYVGLDFIQLHGNEKLDELTKIKKKIKIPIIKAILVNSLEDIKLAHKFEKVCDMILFDTKSPKKKISGGTGLTFDWNLLQDYKASKDWMLAGGLNINNIKVAINKTNAPIVDVSSGVEKSLGVKCQKKIKELIYFVKNKNDDLKDKNEL